MKVTSRGFNPNLGEEFMQRHGASFVVAQRASSQPEQGDVSSSKAGLESEDSPQLGALRIARMRHQNAQLAAQSTKKD